MSISALSSHTPVLPQLHAAVLPKKSDHDGDEVNGADPVGEKDKQPTPSVNPNVGQNLNSYA